MWLTEKRPITKRKMETRQHEVVRVRVERRNPPQPSDSDATGHVREVNRVVGPGVRATGRGRLYLEYEKEKYHGENRHWVIRDSG